MTEIPLAKKIVGRTRGKRRESEAARAVPIRGDLASTPGDYRVPWLTFR